MTDCPNANFRDQLPDLVHERLDPISRAALVAHVDGCADCRDELALLRGVRDVMLARTPAVNVASIVAALPKASATKVVPLRPRRTWADWRVAAAVTLLVAGGGSVAVYRHGTVQSMPADVPSGHSVHSESLAQTPIVNAVKPVANASPTATETLAIASTDDGSEPGLAAATAAANLNDSQLKTLLDDIDRLEAVPITEPEPVSLRVSPRTPIPSDGRGSE
jgi:hypothetical protein